MRILASEKSLGKLCVECHRQPSQCSQTSRGTAPQLTRDTSAEARLWVRLVLTIPVTAGKERKAGFQGFTSELDYRGFQCSLEKGWEGSGATQVNLENGSKKKIQSQIGGQKLRGQPC